MSPAGPEAPGPARARLLRLSHRLDMFFKVWFGRLGLAVARAPIVTVVLSLVVAGLLAIGCLRLTYNAEGKEIWVSQTHSVTLNDRFVEETFGQAIRSEEAILSTPDSTDVATLDGLTQLVDYVQFAEQVRSAEGTTLDDICIRAAVATRPDISLCATVSILDLFIDLDPTQPAHNETYGSAARRALRQLNDSRIKQKIQNNPSFVSWTGKPLITKELVGGTSGTDADFAASALSHKTLVDGRIAPAITVEWEHAFRGALDLSGDRFEFLKVVTFDELFRALNESFEGQLILVVLGLVALTLYIMSTLGKSLRNSRALLAIAALFTVVLALAATAGFASACGVPFTPTQTILPVLILGIGADDSYVLVKTFDALMRYDPAFPSRSVDDRIAISVAVAGSSILVTSATNCFVLFCGALTPVPALQAFSIWAAIGVFFDFFFNVTFFVALFKLDVVRQESKRLDCFPCFRLDSLPFLKTGDEKKESNLPQIRTIGLHRLMSGQYVAVLSLKATQVTIFVFFAGLLGLVIYGLSTLQVIFSASSFYKLRSHQDRYQKAFDRDFDIRLSVGFYSRDVEFWNPTVRARYIETCNPVSGPLAHNLFVENGSVDCWLDTLQPLIQANDKETFFVELQTALASPSGRRYLNDVLCSDVDGYRTNCLGSNATGILSTRATMTIAGIQETTQRVEALTTLTAIAEESEVSTVFVNNPLFPYVQLSASIKRNSLLLTLVSLLAVGLVNLFLIGHPLGALLVMYSVTSTTLLLIAVLQFWGIYLNAVSMIVLGISVGLSIDGSTHITRSFLEHSGTRRERIELALGDVGPAVLHGGVSTLVASSFLAFSDSFVVIVIFKALLTILTGSLLHALVFLPVALLLVGPASFHDSEKDRLDELNTHLEDKLSFSAVDVEEN